MKEKNKGAGEVPSPEMMTECKGAFGEIMRLAQIGLKRENETLEDGKEKDERGRKGLMAISFVAQFLGEVDQYYKEDVEASRK